MSSNRIKSGEIQVGDSFVLPIEQTRVTRQQAKVQQIIEETDAKVQQILNNAENRSQVVIQAANTEAETIIQNAKKRAEQEYEQIKQQAYEEGFKKGEQDGLYKFQNDALQGLKSLDTLASSSYELKKNIIDSASRDIVELVSAIADKVCHQKFDDEVLYKITVDAIKQLNDKENISIIVNPLLVDRINALAPDFRAEFPKLDTLKILEDISLSADGVIVETPDTRLDSRVSVQIAEIAEKFLTGTDDGLEQE